MTSAVHVYHRSEGRPNYQKKKKRKKKNKEKEKSPRANEMREIRNTGTTVTIGKGRRYSTGKGREEKLTNAGNTTAQVRTKTQNTTAHETQ